jgi:hypothetical protein
MATAEISAPPAIGDAEADQAWLETHLRAIVNLVKLDRRPQVFVVVQKDGFAVTTTIPHIEAHIPYTIDPEWSLKVKTEMKGVDTAVVALPGPPEALRIYSQRFDKKEFMK